MNSEMSQPEGGAFVRWVRATTVGWLIGFVLVIVLAVVWDMIGGGAQFMVGAWSLLSTIVLGGPVLGAVTGKALLWISKRSLT